MQSSFTQYVAAVVALNSQYFSRRRSAVQREALADRHVGRDAPAEARWYGEGGNFESAAARHRK